MKITIPMTVEPSNYSSPFEQAVCMRVSLPRNPIIAKLFSSLYSWKSEANSMNEGWLVCCKARNPDLDIPILGLCNKPKYAGIP
ncbi:MAG: hypothetical protein PF517_04835 [Salinivirgaceae bacterium]|jgi:hypothetical protein|nr:hypothetical protein [Salinivirgaceae bacterium]